MRLARVSDARDPRVVEFTGLTDVEARRRREPAQGIFIAEGAKVIARALATGHVVRSVLSEERWLAGLTPLLEQVDADVLVASPEVLREVTGYRVHRGALAAVARPALRPLEDVVAGARLVAVLVDLVDHTNVGAILRNAAALGVDAVVVSPQCADPLYRRSVKVSMGAVLGLPWTRGTPDWLARLRSADLEVLALTPMPAATPIDAVRSSGRPRALLVGTEGTGLPAAVLQQADRRVRIPMAPGIDSLNVAAASAIAFHVLGRPG